jgi:NAD(P)-dependent dehydrogenase (short-subunit alcohol dehydrogenase family)
MKRIALVTGGMGGLGEAICIKLAKRAGQYRRHNLLTEQHQGSEMA